MRRAFAIAALGVMLAGPVFAVLPDEILPDPALEARARELSKGLRCLVCRNESIDESNADLARDLRLLVRERIVAGDTDAEVVAWLVDRYGEYVLLNPPATGSTLILWVAGPAMLLLGLGGAAIYLRRRRGARDGGDVALSDAEQARVDEILRS
jgi:cytochrome c-type biogenesis protein CcmH